ncbi:MAG: hypothetical protein ACYTHN_13340, partial [Planctomycetota bacterium]
IRRLEPGEKMTVAYFESIWMGAVEVFKKRFRSEDTPPNFMNLVKEKCKEAGFKDTQEFFLRAATDIGMEKYQAAMKRLAEKLTETMRVLAEEKTKKAAQEEDEREEEEEEEEEEEDPGKKGD